MANVNISAVIITFNEEKNIGRCLTSLEGIVDEIVVVDSFSTDSTEQIVKQHKGRFVSHKFDGHIEQKNWAITQSSNPIVLSLDADEALSDKMKKAILEIKENWQYDGYVFNRLTNFCGKWINKGSWYPDRKLRLWDSRKGQWGGLNPHDRFEMPGSSIQQVDADILHYSYYTLQEFKDKIESFSSISANALFTRQKPFAFYQLIINPIWRFFKGYLLKLGFLMGKPGFQIEWGAAKETYLKYHKLNKLYKKLKA